MWMKLIEEVKRDMAAKYTRESFAQQYLCDMSTVRTNENRSIR
jgi:hypothetical protein